VDLEYKGAKIHAYKREWQELSDKGKEAYEAKIQENISFNTHEDFLKEFGKFLVTKREFCCQLYRTGSVNQPLNLGQMSDGSKFTAVAQAVNEAKWLVDYHLEQEVDRKLLSEGFLREELFQYNRLRINERLQVKEKLLLDKDLVELKNKEKKERDDLDLKEKFDIFLPALEKEFNETIKVLIVGRFVVTKFHDKVESFLIY